MYSGASMVECRRRAEKQQPDNRSDGRHQRILSLRFGFTTRLVQRRCPMVVRGLCVELQKDRVRRCPITKVSGSRADIEEPI